MSGDQKTIDIYDQRAGEYAKNFDDPDQNPHLEAFIATMPISGHVLDLGCGPGRSAARMIEHGLTVDAVDASAEMAAIARTLHNIDVRIETFDAISGTAIYDGVWAHFSLLHASKAALPRHLAALHQAMKPQAKLSIALKLGEGETRDSLGRFYAYYSEAEIGQLLATSGFTVITKTLGAGKGLAGDTEPWIMVDADA